MEHNLKSSSAHKNEYGSILKPDDDSNQSLKFKGSFAAQTSSGDEVKAQRKTLKGKLESHDLKKFVNGDQSINHITSNQTQEYFAVAT